jgi:hypothetical protein
MPLVGRGLLLLWGTVLGAKFLRIRTLLSRRYSVPDRRCRRIFGVACVVGFLGRLPGGFVS